MVARDMALYALIRGTLGPSRTIPGAYTKDIAAGVPIDFAAAVALGGVLGVIPKRVRHHTNIDGLKGIKSDKHINAAREGGVHVETQPFGPTRGAIEQLGAFQTRRRRGYVEFDRPDGIQPPLEKSAPKRNTGFIPTQGARLDIAKMNPEYRNEPIWHFLRREWFGVRDD